MAKQDSNKRIVQLRATTLATFQGTFAAIIGLGVAILYSLENTVEVADATDSVLRGMAFGMATGLVSLLVLPIVYFAFGWVIGLIQGWVFNAVLGASGGIAFRLEDEK